MDETAAAPSSRSPYQRWASYWFVLGLLLFFVILSVQYSIKAAQPGSRSAIQRWLTQLEHLDDVNIWEKGYPNPPIMALLLQSLTHLPPLAAALCWFYAKVAMTLVALYWVFRLVETTGRPFPPWAKALTILLSLRPIMGDLSHGNVNLFILFLVVAALYAFHRGLDFTCGITLALAIACKVTPALFIPYFLWKRAWKPLAGCAVGLVLFLFLVPGLFLGMERNVRLFGSWVDQMVKPFVVSGVVTTEHNNQSLPGLVHRLTTHSPSFIEFDANDQPVPVRYDNFVTLDPSVARWIVKGFMALFAAAVVWTCRTPTSTRDGWRLAAEFSLVVLGMLLFSERTWKHHCVTLVLPFGVIAYYLAACRPSPKVKWYLIGTLAAVVFLMETTSTSLLGDGPAKTAQAYGAYVWAYILLAVALMRLLSRKDGDVIASVEPMTTTSQTLEAA